MEKERLDVVVQRQAGISRSQAQGLILTGSVTGPDGAVLDKPGARIAADTALTIRAGQRFVSRGGDKLEAAFEAFKLNVETQIAIDVGASTGGFTDCLLQHGAAKVFAVDVGYGQLAWKLRQDARVIVLERTNIRHLSAEALGERPTFFTADCSFISLRLVLPALLPLLGDAPQGVVLIKPQFEAGPVDVGKGGVVRDDAVRTRVIDEVCAVARGLGFAEIDVLRSPLLGPAGNVEFLAWLRAFRAPVVT